MAEQGVGAWQQPITREDLRDELKHYASSAEVQEMKAELTREFRDKMDSHLRWYISLQLAGLGVVATTVAAVVGAITLANS